MYDRWGMTEADGSTLTGATLTEAGMTAAEDELVDVIGWRPDPGRYTVTGTAPNEAALAFGRAVAWQAAYRTSTPADANDGDAAVEAESITDYSVTYAAPVTEAPLIAARARRLLTRWGWYRNAGVTGHTRPGYADPLAFQNG